MHIHTYIGFPITRASHDTNQLKGLSKVPCVLGRRTSTGNMICDVKISQNTDKRIRVRWQASTINNMHDRLDHLQKQRRKRTKNFIFCSSGLPGDCWLIGKVTSYRQHTRVEWTSVTMAQQLSRQPVLRTRGLSPFQVNRKCSEQDMIRILEHLLCFFGQVGLFIAW